MFYRTNEMETFCQQAAKRSLLTAKEFLYLAEVLSGYGLTESEIKKYISKLYQDHKNDRSKEI